MDHPTAVSPGQLARRLGGPHAPALLDVRRRAAFEQAERLIAASHWRDPAEAEAWVPGIAPGSEVIVYCVHGHQVSQAVAARLRARGVRAAILEGGIEAWLAAGGPSVLRAAFPGGRVAGGSRWVTRERPKIDRLACPWLIRRFIDPDAEIHYVEAQWVEAVAEELGGTPFDVPDVAFSHVGERCSFDAFLDLFGIEDAALRRLAEIVRGADTGRPDLAPQAAGLLAMSLGLSTLHDDDRRALDDAMVIYDALHAWCRDAAGQSHDWRPVATGGVSA